MKTKFKIITGDTAAEAESKVNEYLETISDYERGTKNA
jgi:hypothetical protein